MELSELLARIRPADQAAMQRAQARWDSIAKPLGSLGLLETALVRIAGMTGSEQISLEKRAVMVFCADNGVVAEGVTQTGSEVTAAVAENFARGQTSVCAMARAAHCEVYPVDLGVARDLHEPGMLIHKIAYGTANIAQGPAMTRDQALDAICYGAELAMRLAGEGCRILATGEMGIGNTTTAAAVAAVLLGLSSEQAVGRGAGLSDAGLLRKREVVAQAIAVNAPDSSDPLDVLAKVGGFDLAGMCGAFLGGAAAGVPVLVDGFISAAAALLAVRLCPAAGDYLLASHVSQEPAAGILLGALGLRPFLTAEMRLGEGTGAVAALPILDLALAVYREMSTFSEVAIDAYQPQC